MRAAGFERSIAVQARQTLEETRWLLALADAHPFIAGVVGWVDLRSPTVDAQLEAVAPHPQAGRRAPHRPGRAGRFPGFARRSAAASSRLERFGLTYDILIYARQLPEAVAFVRALPEQRFVLDHLGEAGHQGRRLRPRGAVISRRLAAFPHVWCKLSGLVTEADWDRGRRMICVRTSRPRSTVSGRSA